MPVKPVLRNKHLRVLLNERIEWKQVGGRVTEAIWIQEVECFQKKDGKETVIPERGYTEIETHQIFY